MPTRATEGGQRERGGRGMMMGRAGVDVDEGQAHGPGHQGRERRVVRLAPPSSPPFSGPPPSRFHRPRLGTCRLARHNC